MFVSFNNGVDFISFMFPENLHLDADECNIVEIKIKIETLCYKYFEEFLTAEIQKFYSKISQNNAEKINLYGIGFSLSIKKTDELGHYDCFIDIDNMSSQIKINAILSLSRSDFDRIFQKIED